jgi:hypothetical protein
VCVCVCVCVCVICEHYVIKRRRGAGATALGEKIFEGMMDQGTEERARAKGGQRGGGE